MNTTGNMLRLARQLRALQQNEVCVALGVNPSELSRIENGMKDAADEVIEAASRLYKLPKSFFAQTETLYGAPVSVHAPQWRKKADVSAGDLHRITAELNVRAIHLRRLLEATDMEPLRELPRLDSDEYDNDGHRVANLLRRHWMLPAGPIPDLTSVIEEAGVVVAHSDFGGASISGVTFRIPGVPPLIVLNASHPGDRMRFTLGHELAHLVMHRFPTPDMEKEADAFASSFLVPVEDIRPQMSGRRVDLRLLAALKPEWRVSMQMLVFVAERAGVISSAQKTFLFKQFSASGLRLREPPELNVSVEQPKILSDLLALHMGDLGYSVADLAKAMRMNEDEVASTYMLNLLEERERKAHLRIVK